LQAAPDRSSYDELAEHTEPRIIVEPPGPRARAVVEADSRVTSPSLPRAYPFAPARGAGAVVEDVDGNLFLDFNAAIAVCSTGHCHPEVVGAMQSQAEKLLHYSASDFYLPIYSQMCARLAEIVPLNDARAFLTNSGTEAVEAALKLARHATGRQYVIGFFGAFHGRTYGSVSVSASSARYRAGFGPLLPGVLHAPYGDRLKSYVDMGDASREEAAAGYIEDVIFTRLAAPQEIAAIVLEPVLGEGGYVVPPARWVQNLRDICNEHGILLVADEIQSGMGRTGAMWALEHFDVVPDIILVGKGIASGMPLGAMIARGDLMTWGAGTHGSTYGGNPVSCAAALATIDLIEKELAARASEVGELLLRGLRSLRDRIEEITDVRGLGLMIGVEFASPGIAHAVQLECFRRGVLTLRAGDATVRISPPLVINKAQAAAGLRVFEQACTETSSSG
jgi:4-aminobutyrate aminotransferase